MPLIQLVPLLMEYCQLAPASRPATLIVPLLVFLSVALTPLSLAKTRLEATAVVSTVMVAPSWPLALVLPAISLWRTRMLPAA